MIKKNVALTTILIVVLFITSGCGSNKREVTIYNKTGAVINEVIIDADNGPTTRTQNPDEDTITIKLNKDFDDCDNVTVLMITNHDEEYSEQVSLKEKGATKVTIDKEDYKAGNPLEELRRKANRFFNND